MKKAIALLVIVLFALSFILSACDAVSPQSATCAYVVGSGTNGYDAKVHNVVYPGQSLPDNNTTGEVVHYVPCNSRNYIINDGTDINANNEKVGDRYILTKATTKSGTQITIASSSFWTLNQSNQAMRDFYSVCFKYTCFSDSDQGGGANFSTKGWNGLLSENFGPAVDAAARRAAAEVTDDVWQTHDPSQYKALAALMSKYFADEVRARFGFPEDLFCGSGNSGWADSNKPGVGEFTCTPVRVIVEDVEVLQMATDSGTQAQADLNAARLAAAEQLYGPGAAFWVGLQDTIDKCKGAGTTCVFNISPSGEYLPVTIPAKTPAPAVTTTPTATP